MSMRFFNDQVFTRDDGGSTTPLIQRWFTRLPRRGGVEAIAFGEASAHLKTDSGSEAVSKWVSARSAHAAPPLVRAYISGIAARLVPEVSECKAK